MTEINSSDAAHHVDKTLVNKAVDDYSEGIRSRSLTKLLADIDEQRRTDPGAMKEFLTAVNNKLPGGFGIVPPLLIDSGQADILGVEGRDHSHTLTVNADGKPLSYGTPDIPDKQAATISDLSAQPYSNISPPGLAELPPGTEVKAGWYESDFTLNGENARHEDYKLTVLSRESQSVTNADGTTTYNYKGKLDSSFVADLQEDEVLVKTGNVGFSASETISADGKVLRRHIDYQPAEQKRTWDGLFGIHSDINLEHKRTLNVLNAQFYSAVDNGQDIKSLDTKYNPATGRYDTKASYLDGRVVAMQIDRSGQAISLSANNCSGAIIGTIEASGQDRNSSGFVTQAYNTGEIYHHKRTKTTEIKRDANNEVIEFTDVKGQTTKRLAGDSSRWIGPEGPFKAEVFSDNGGNIVEKTEAGSTIVTADGDYVWLDREGRMTRKLEHSLKVDRDTTYTLNADGNKIGTHTVEIEHIDQDYVRRSITDYQQKPSRAEGFDLTLLPKFDSYCKVEQ